MSPDGLEILRENAPQDWTAWLEKYRREDMEHDAHLYQEELDDDRAADADRQSEIHLVRYGY